MRKIVGNFFKKLILYPVKVRHCSQSVYRSLLGCLYLWDFSNDQKWRLRAETLCSILIDIQTEDGGFDNGYDYNFGRFHKKGEPIAPEATGLLVLVEYYKRFGGIDVEVAMKRAASWIANNAFEVGDSDWAIPYGPYSSKDVIVYNGTSFAAGALGTYLSVFFDYTLERIYHGMNQYLYHVMSSSDNQPGKFWYYADQSRKDLTAISRSKIDYYHQMQQAEVHAWAELCLSSPLQKEMILAAVEHVASKQSDNGLIPYYNIDTDVHLWGYCSCASGFIVASKLDTAKSQEYIKRAKSIISWILKYSWNGDYFFPIVDKSGVVKDKRFYVRSDAWVFNALALAIREKVIDSSFVSICDRNYIMMERTNFSGPENHATNIRIRVAKKIMSQLVGLWPK